jgi:hypothetical protein
VHRAYNRSLLVRASCPQVSYRELRMQLGGLQHNKRHAEAQCDWQAVNMPLPAPSKPT